MSATAPDAVTVRLHRLTMVADNDGVTIGRPDIASYAVFPEEGADLLRMLGSGASLSEAAAWYEQTCGETLDMEDFLDSLRELRFLREQGEPEPAMAPVRWQRLGRRLFSWPAWLCYLALTASAAVEMVRTPSLRPSYHHVFFTTYLALIPVATLTVAIPCILIHEGFHTLAGRRLGLPSRLAIGRRLYYLVAETRLDALLSVPRKRRYLPFLAGMLADVVMVSALTLLSVALDHGGIPPWCHKICLAAAFTCVLRLIWQLRFYLETDLYFVIANALRCSDLQPAARFQLRVWLRRALRRRPPQPEAEWTDRDRAMARRYAPLLLAGYAFSLAGLAWAGIPTFWHFWATVVDRLTREGAPATVLLDAAVFIALIAAELSLLIYVTLRDRRARSRGTSSKGARP